MFLITRARDLYRELANLAGSIHHWRNEIMSALDNLKAKVEELKTVDQSVKALLQGLKAQLDAALDDDDLDAIQAIADSIGIETLGLADAVAANTPQEPAPAPAEPPAAPPAEPEQPAAPNA